MSKKFLYRLTALFLFSLFLFNFSCVSFGAIDSLNQITVNSNTTDSDSEESDPLGICAEAAIVIDQNTGKVLYGKHNSKRMYPASTTKLMTAILTLEKCNLNDVATVSYYAAHSVPYSYSIANLWVGEKFTIKDLLCTLMISSANDSAYVLAQYIANGGNTYNTGSDNSAKESFDSDIAKFSEMMNSKAKELGCSSTNFVNPNGIHNENHYSTASDLALIGRYAYNNQTLMDIVGKLNYTLPSSDIYTGDIRSSLATNTLINSAKKGYYEYANGLKTGFTDAAGYCIIASAKKGDMSLIAVVLNSDNLTNSDTSMEADCKRLFEYGFKNYTYCTLMASGTVAETTNIFNGTSETKSLNLIVKDDLKALVATGLDGAVDITPKINITKYSAPIAKGDIIGTIIYTIDGENFSSDLIAEHDVESSGSMNLILILLVIFALLLLIFTLFSKKNKRKSKRMKKKHKAYSMNRYYDFK